MVLLEREIQEKLKAVSKRRPLSAPNRVPPRLGVRRTRAAGCESSAPRYGPLQPRPSAAPLRGRWSRPRSCKARRPSGARSREHRRFHRQPPAVQKVLSALPADFARSLSRSICPPRSHRRSRTGSATPPARNYGQGGGLRRKTAAPASPTWRPAAAISTWKRSSAI